MRFSYAGIDLPAPASVDLELQPIDSAERNAQGDLLIDEITLKLKLVVSWKALNGVNANRLMAALRNNRIGLLSYFDISTSSMRSIQVYYGAGAAVSYFRFDDSLARQLYKDISVNFIQI